MSELLQDSHGCKVRCSCGEVTSYYELAKTAWEHQAEHEELEHGN